MLIAHLRYAVNKELKHLNVYVVNVLRTPEFQLLVLVCGLEVVLKETKVSHYLEVRDCLCFFGGT